MPNVNWKLITGLLIALVLVAVVALRLTRRVPPYNPPSNRTITDWGSLDNQTAQRLQNILDQNVNHLIVPGLQAFVRTPDGRTWSGTSGTTDLRRKHFLGREDILRVGSTTKTFTAVLILQLVEEGLLRLDDPLSLWFPDFPNAGRITVRQLLNHSSGISEFLEDPAVMMKSILSWRAWKLQELLDIAAKREPYFSPGSDWHYSNSNYVLLGLIAEQITGKTFAQLLREKLLDPMNLTHTFFVPNEPEPDALLRGYDRDLSHFPGFLDIGVKSKSWATAAHASGALASTADDLGLFYSRLFAGELLSPDMMEAMLTFIPASNPGFDPQVGYGLGLMQLNVDGQELIGHVGEFMGSTAIAMYAPDTGSLVVVTANMSYPDLVKVVSDLLADIQPG